MLFRSKNRIEIEIGCCENIWFACCPTIPWLATEGESYLVVVNTMVSIAPKLSTIVPADSVVNIVWRKLNEND